MKISTKKITGIINFVCLALLAGCVSQGDLNTLDTRLNELEIRNAEAKKRRDMLQTGLQSREKQEQALRHQAASVRAKMDALNEQIRVLTGRVEELEHLYQRQIRKDADIMKEGGKRLDKLAQSSKSNDERLSRIEQYLNFESTTQTTPIQKTDVTKIPGVQPKQKPSEDEIYRLAKQAFDQGDSDVATKKFQELIVRFPKSERADNAQFWIGEIYYREKWYEKSILEYQKVIENYPKGNKVPASLLKQGLAFLHLGDKANSRLILQELVKKYPKSNEAKIAKDKLKSL